MALVVLIAALTGAAAALGSLTGGPTHTSRAGEIAAAVDPGLVDVTAPGDTGLVSMGTGMVVSSSGTVLTNNHVIEGATSVRVTDLGNQRTYPATVEGYDRTADVAVLRLAGARQLATVAFRTAAARVGTRVVTIGNAGGKGGTPTTSTGRIVAVGKTVTAQSGLGSGPEQLVGMIAADAPIWAGDSGGPVVDAAGKVIGMDTAGTVPGGPGGTAVRSFAIPAATALAVARQITAGRSTADVHLGPTPLLGVRVVTKGPGLVVAAALPGDPAAAAGLRPGDTLLTIAGRPADTVEELTADLGAHHPGDTVTVTWHTTTGRVEGATVTLDTGSAG